MLDDWLRVRDVVARYGVSRNTPRNWFKNGDVRMRGGKFSRRDIERELDRKSIGPKPGKKTTQPHLRDLSTREKELTMPFMKQQHGLRNLRRLLWTLPIAANILSWSAKKRLNYAEVLRDGANAISPNLTTASPPTGELLRKRRSERKRLTDASHTNVTKKTGVIVFEQADPAREPGYEIVPFGIRKADEQYVLIDARDPIEFCNRAKERGYEIPTEKGDPTIARPHPLEEHYTPDFAAEIDSHSKRAHGEADDILEKYAAITDPVQKECFRHRNFDAIQAARMDRAKPANWENLSNIAARCKGKRWKCTKIDDGYGFKVVPAKLG